MKTSYQKTLERKTLLKMLILIGSIEAFIQEKDPLPEIEPWKFTSLLSHNLGSHSL